MIYQIPVKSALITFNITKTDKFAVLAKHALKT